MTGRPRTAICLFAALALCLGAIAAPVRAQTGDDPVALGTKALQAGRLGEAKASFEKAVAANAGVAAAKRGLGEIATRRGRLADAEKLYREAIAATTAAGGKVDPDLRVSLGLALIRLNRADDSAGELQQALADAPGNWTVIYGQARLLLAKEQWESAKALLDKGEARQGLEQGEDKYHFGMALYRLGTDNLDEAEREAMRSLSLDASDPERVTLLAQICTRRNTQVVAITGIEQIRKTPGFVPTAPLLDQLGTLYQQAKVYDKAIYAYRDAFKADSTFAPPLLKLGDLYRTKVEPRMPNQAARFLNTYTKLNPGDVNGYVELCYAWSDFGATDRAAIAARDALSRAPLRMDLARLYIRKALRSSDKVMRQNGVSAFMKAKADTTWKALDWIDVADVQREAQQWAAARASVEQARTMMPDSPGVFVELGKIALSEGQSSAADPQKAALGAALFDTAVAKFRKAIEMRGDNPSYYANLSSAYQAQKKAGEARAAMRSALKLNSQYSAGRFRLAGLLLATDSLTAAAAQYDAVLTYDPKSAEALRGRGYVLMRQRDFAGAVKCYATLTEIDAGNPESWVSLGDALINTGDFPAAEKALTKAKSLDPENAAVKKGFELLAARKASGQKG